MTTAFIEERLPDTISYGSSGGPGFLTDIYTAASGGEQRNQNWEEARAKYDISYGVHSKEDMAAIRAFFFVMRGRLIGFRYKDWSDYELDDEVISVADGVTTEFQITKTYAIGSEAYVRAIRKPVDGSLVGLTVNDVPMVENTDFTIDYTTGIITFTSAPATGDIKIGYLEFDVPVRFDTDDLSSIHEGFLTETLSSIPLVELRADAT